jgi:hypothetical protein
MRYFNFASYWFQFLGFSQIPNIPGSIGGVSTSTILNKTKGLVITQLDESKAEYGTTSL